MTRNGWIDMPVDSSVGRDLGGNTCVPWTIFFLSESLNKVVAENVLAPHSPPHETLFFNVDTRDWSLEREVSSVQVLGAVKGWHQAAAFTAFKFRLEDAKLTAFA
tara:strand:- start:1000 stop:1314 length:315 start_codon:yes stop_codon:yes gene_type:complete